ncbi:MAG TPA: MarR family winged helix-turn-helix transcriptional regulator [Pseudonocardia sp.]
MSPLTSLFTDLVRVETRLWNAVDDRMRAAHGMTLGQYELMQVIQRRTTTRVYDIVSDVAITVGAASKAVDRLEAAGWCVRSANPLDRRSSLIALTPEGARLLAAATPTLEDELAARVEGVVEASELDQLAAVLAVLRASLEEHHRGRTASRETPGGRG